MDNKEQTKEKENVTLIELKKLENTSEKIAREIRMLSRAFKTMANSGLYKETLVLLLHNSSNIGKPDIRAILKAMDNLERDYLVPEKK
jgi:hypothetical protein